MDIQDPTTVKVSLIIPFYNAQSSLAKCLDSLIHQSLKEIEIIMVNDGSTDLSEGITKSYSKIDPRIKLFKQSHSGPGIARNLGIEHSNAPYITFVDSDDEADLDYCKILYESATSQNYDLVIGRYRNVKNNSIKSLSSFYQISGNKVETIKNLYLGKLSIGIYSKLYKKDFLKRHHIIFPPLYYNEDRHFLLQCFYFSDKTHHINNILYHRNVHHLSAMNRIQKQHLIDAREVLDLDIAFLKKNDAFNKVVHCLYLAHLKVVSFIFKGNNKRVHNSFIPRQFLLHSLDIHLHSVRDPVHRLTLSIIKSVMDLEMKIAYQKCFIADILIRIATKLYR